MKRYPQYRPSSVEWLGEIPADWPVRRLRFSVTVNPSKAEVGGLNGDATVSFVPMEAVGEWGGLRLDQTRSLDDVAKGYTYFADGDVVVAKITPCFENGKGALADGLENGVGFGTTELHVLRALPTMGRRYLFYLTLEHAFRNIGASFMYGAGGQKRVPEDFIRDFRHPIPPIETQRAIAAFLDRETARIDALIEKKQRQIELLQEKRAALITHAVTKGLNPDAPMKDSGVEWLGRIPKHWTVTALKRVATFQRGHDITGDEMKEGGVPVISSAGIAGTHDQPRAKGPGIVTGRYGTIGEFYYINSDFWPTNTTLYGVCYWGNNVRFLWYALKSMSALFLVNSSKSAVPGVDRNDLHPIEVAVPPVNEQGQIAAVLDAQAERVELLREKIRRSIDLLREYRTALISAAVTGKIDVRA